MFCLSKQLLFITIMYMYMHIVNLFLRLAKSVHVYTTVHFDANTCYVLILQIKLQCLLYFLAPPKKQYMHMDEIIYISIYRTSE